MSEEVRSDESTVTISLGGDATYEVYQQMFDLVGGMRPWQRKATGGKPDGWNICLNGDDVKVTNVSDEGISVRNALDEHFETFADERFVSWDDVTTIVIY